MNMGQGGGKIFHIFEYMQFNYLSIRSIIEKLHHVPKS